MVQALSARHGSMAFPLSHEIQWVTLVLALCLPGPQYSHCKGVGWTFGGFSAPHPALTAPDQGRLLLPFSGGSGAGTGESTVGRRQTAEGSIVWHVMCRDQRRICHRVFCVFSPWLSSWGGTGGVGLHLPSGDGVVRRGLSGQGTVSQLCHS